MPKYLLQLEDRGAFVGDYASQREAEDAVVLEHGFAPQQWQDHPRGERGKFSKVFKNAKHIHPVAVAYPSDGKTLWIWHDPTA